MPAFQYEALNLQGKKQTGIVEAENIKQCRQLLRNQGLIPVKTRIANQPSSSLRKKFENHTTKFRATLSNKELALITRQFSTLLSAGLPVEEVLSAVSEQTENDTTKGLILSVRGKVLEGYSLANAMRDFPRAFSSLYCSTVAAGEKTGHLDIVLARLANFSEQQYFMRQKIKNALIYPSIMILISFFIVGFLLEYVVPKMVAVYSDTGQALPGITQLLISISEFIKEYGLYFLGLCIVAIFFLQRTIAKNPAFKEKVHRFYLRLPIVGKAIKTINTARFARTFAIASAAGVAVLEALSIASKLINNIPIRKAVEEATHRIRTGAAIHLALRQTGYFPPMSIHLIASGEASGQLEPMLERAADNQENDIRQLIETGLTLFEPAIILIMGAIVLFIVLAILLPIFQLDQMTG